MDNFCGGFTGTLTYSPYIPGGPGDEASTLSIAVAKIKFMHTCSVSLSLCITAVLWAEALCTKVNY